MADTDRLSLLPTIKCSNCAVDIDILQLADHVCATNIPDVSEPTSPTLDRAATFGDESSFNNRSESQPRMGRMPPPPRIDSFAANKPFRPQDLAPSPMSNYSDSKSFSSLSPRSGGVPFKMNRSATSPLPRPLGPPSPDLPSNMDSAFPPFPTARSATPTSARSNYGERLEPTYNQQYAEPSPLYAPLSPRTNGGESVLKRMNALAPGPFGGNEGGRRPSMSSGQRTPASASEFGHKRTGTQSSIRSNGNANNQRTSLASNASHGSTFSNRSVGLPTRPKPGMGAMGAMPPPPRPARTDEGIDAFLTRLQKETTEPSQIDGDSRSRTFPEPRRPSESNGLSRRPTDIDTFNPAPRSNNMFPMRSTSRGGSNFAVRRDDLPPPPMPNYAKELPPNPLHTPSDSGLSDDSVSSAGFRSAASSRSSPPASEAGHSRQPSKARRADYVSEEPIPRVASPESFMDPRPPPQIENRKVPSSYNRGRAPEPLSQPSPMPFSNAPETPMDPAIQPGLSSEKRPIESPSVIRDPALNLAQSPPERTPKPESRRPMNRRVTTASKGRCRGCSEPIYGKSVKDASGRLTGRYHKQCFNCRTCRDPFPSAEFYVFDNSPYCEQHYHELNGSLCRSCNRGIEGQYLETDQRQKFHPRCFTCLTCRIVLRDDYYEVGRKVYCERHAYHAAQQNTFLGSGGNQSRNLQKRRTRMMMMM